MNAMTTKLLPSQSGHLGILHLNHPKAYHALNLDMILAAQQIMNTWLASPDIKAILWHSSTDTKRPTFCSGGDVKSIAVECRDNLTAIHGQGTRGLLSADFFRQEYYLNHALAERRKVQISIWDGLVFGGGVGISIFGKYRVATENTLFAMPETAIGFFPDVGALWAMSHIVKPPSLLAYLVLTGHRLEAADLMQLGLATHYVPSKELPELKQALVESTETSSAVDPIAPVLLAYHQTPTPTSSVLTDNKPIMDQVFDFTITSKSMDNVVEELKALDTDFGKTTLTSLQGMSPTALSITWELLRRGQNMSNLADHLTLEYRLSQHLMKPDSDFHEGIRGTLLDKQAGPPKWKPVMTQDELVQYYFEQPIEHEWDITESPLYRPTSISTSKL